MHQSKGAVRVQEVIGALCRMLTATGLDSVPTPEVFRRAKFNCGPEVEDPLWKLLASVLKTCNIISVEASPELPEMASDHRRLVAVGLWQSGYHVDWIRCVGEQGGECVPCSRELLLALGWLLATGAVETLLAHRAKQLDSTRWDPAVMTAPTVGEAHMDRPSLRKLQWLFGSLRSQRRSLLSMQEEQSKLVTMECVRMQDLSQLLKSYTDWKHTEKLFWVWMDSVVEGHATDQRVACPLNSDANASANRSRAVCPHGDWGLECLNDMLLGLPTVQRKRGQRGEEKEPGGRRRGQESDDRPPAERDGGTAPPLPPCLSPSAQGYRLRLQGEAGDPGALRASERRRLLMLTESSLLEGRERCQRANRMQFQEMIGRLEDMVLIAP
ncbi:tubulin epsilon and delta complex protein 1-like isoform X3 [Gadus chalcogrammus]|uniref:tubulin epsilon and delta complex protein 1-like isoform X3 n=1 Tax=Gadus chalcogrammus TaxID=1042646 RepID=UPI0024C32EC2|nr:tubulin epsilon and delta complex protein 1-like isoform X3 [Gadus chalcogrammus]